MDFRIPKSTSDCLRHLAAAIVIAYVCVYYTTNDFKSTEAVNICSSVFTPSLQDLLHPPQFPAVSKSMGHAKELITMDVYADNREIIADGVPEIEAYMEMVLPNMEENELFKNELLEIVVDVTEFLPRIA